MAADENAGPGQPSTFAASSGAVITTFAAESARMWRTEDARVGREHLGAVRQQHDDAVPGADVHARQRRRHARGRPVLVYIGEVAPLEVQGGVLAEALDALVSEPRQVHAPDATIAAMRWLVLGLAWPAMAMVAHAVDDPPLRVPDGGAASAQARFNEGRALAERRDRPAAECKYRDAARAARR